MREGPAGKVLIESYLPSGFQVEGPLTASKLKQLLTDLAINKPDKYAEVIDNLKEVARIGANYSGAYPFSLKHLRPHPLLDQYRQEVKQAVTEYFQKQPVMDNQERGQELAHKLFEITEKYYKLLEPQLADHPIYTVVKSGVRGNPTTVKRFLLSDGVYLDSWDRLIPYPIFNNFSQGLSPAEYWASNYGSKKGIVGTKLAPQDAGDLYKQLMRATHRLIVVDVDGPEVNSRPDFYRGVPVSVSDDDIAGSYLAAPVKKGNLSLPPMTLITPQVLEKLRNAGVDEVLVRSPIAGGPPQGLYSVALGARGGRLPELGLIAGLEAAQAVGERISQMSVGKKHMGAIAGGIGSVTSVLQQLINVPKSYPGGAIHSSVTGVVREVRPSAFGGKIVRINDVEYTIPGTLQCLVKVGDKVEAGDVISSGLPNPQEFVRNKGIGEARRLFTNLLIQSLSHFGLPIHRRNAEIIARGLIDWVAITKPILGYNPGDIVSYNVLEHQWQPRPGSKREYLDSAKGKYLEEPILHYSIGTPVTESVIQTLKKWGVKDVLVHEQPPPFEGFIEPARTYLRHDPDFLAKLLGSYQKRMIMEAAAFGGLSEKYRTTSFVPALAEGLQIGRQWPQRVLSVTGNR
ncbi:MAG: hypothetical protein KatS3mg087_0137 [Patescibacteria group bacterium]|nr:MAG: hypothetical protein KatS3mg087_0137 [Patescibacteria group bacterium]